MPGEMGAGASKECRRENPVAWAMEPLPNGTRMHIHSNEGSNLDLQADIADSDRFHLNLCPQESAPHATQPTSSIRFTAALTLV